MSFRAVYAVADAWHAARWPAGFEWRLLMLLARNTDNETLTVIRSQDRLGKELGVSGRHVRTHLKAWRDRGVLHIIEHGGGTGRKPAKYAINLDALKVVAMREAERVHQSDRATAERKRFHSGEAKDLKSSSRNSCTSGVEALSPEIAAVPQFCGSVETSTVSDQLRNSGDVTPEQTGTNSGSAGLPTLHRVIDSENSSEVGAVQTEAPKPTNSLAMATGALASSPGRKVRRPAETQIQHKVEELAKAGFGEAEIARQLVSQSISAADVRRYYRRLVRACQSP